jgi:hypothetical protein
MSRRRRLEGRRLASFGHALAACLAVGLGLSAGPASAATLDVAPAGADLVFTWDTGRDDLLRGTTPDNLLPWQVGVTSPLLVPGENALRGEHAFYRLASGSNMAYRIERTFLVDDPIHPTPIPTTLPERRSYDTATELLLAWPTLQEVTWWDLTTGRQRGGARVAGVMFDVGALLPRHGGVALTFSADTTITLVGSHDDTYGGPTVDDLGPRFSNRDVKLLPVPPHVRAEALWELLCGEPGLDWRDDDGDTNPDACGRDLDLNGTRDTGLWTGCAFMSLHRRSDASGAPAPATDGVIRDLFFLRDDCTGGRIDLLPGHAYDAGGLVSDWVTCPGGGPAANLPFRLPTW